ncbi:MAG: adenylyl-sulfate kinase [Pseudomonadota bacterium]
MNKTLSGAGTIFITGISASGKSTLGGRLHEGLTGLGRKNIKLLDGEDVRAELAKRGKYYGYSPEDRRQVSLQIAELALEYNQQGISCIVCSICHRRELRKEMRAIIGNVMEVYLDCSVDVCAKRDYKGNYAKAFQGLCDNFVGVSEPYQASDQVELVLYTGRDPIEKCSGILLAAAVKFLEEQITELEGALT